MTALNQSLDLIRSIGFTDLVTTARAVRADRASSTQEAILKAAERLFAEHGVFAVSNRQVSEAAGQGNNAAVGYHFGTKTDLVRAIEQKHRAPIERLRESMVAETGDSTELRDWVACLVCPLTEHLAATRQPDLVRALRRTGDGRPRLPEHRGQGCSRIAVAGPGRRGHHPLPSRSADGRRSGAQHHGAQPDDAHVRRL